MANQTERLALISVSDKRGIGDFASDLESLGFTIVSTGGTATFLQESGVAVTKVEDITHFPELFGGRVKTTHPLITGGILWRRDNDQDKDEAKEHGVPNIDVVVCNLYPFEQTIQRSGVTFQEAIEKIDIGGPTMLRAAAKNHESVVVVVDPEDYNTVGRLLREGQVTDETRRFLAAKTFRYTANYEELIAGYFANITAGELRK